MDRNKHKILFKFPKGVALGHMLVIIAVLVSAPGILYYAIPALGLPKLSIIAGAIFLIWALMVYMINI